MPTMHPGRGKFDTRGWWVEDFINRANWSYIIIGGFAAFIHYEGGSVNRSFN
jgi:hypothetical protein